MKFGKLSMRQRAQKFGKRGELKKSKSGDYCKERVGTEKRRRRRMT
jgi:hypothetical protein